MNVSELPLQCKAYSCALLPRYEDDLFCKFGEIKKMAETDDGDREIMNRIDLEPVWKSIGHDLCKRLEDLDDDIEVAPCGAVARGYLCWAMRNCPNLTTLQRYRRKAPHPSRWHLKRERASTRALVDRIIGRALS